MLSKNMITGKCFRDGMEITTAEYKIAVSEAREKTVWVNRIVAGTAVLQDAPAEWQADILVRVEERQTQTEAEPEELTETEAKAAAYDILVGGGV